MTHLRSLYSAQALRLQKGYLSLQARLILFNWSEKEMEKEKSEWEDFIRILTFIQKTEKAAMAGKKYSQT